MPSKRDNAKERVARLEHLMEEYHVKTEQLEARLTTTRAKAKSAIERSEEASRRIRRASRPRKAG